MDKENIELLLNAILLQAVMDWRRSCTYGKIRIEYQVKKNPLFAGYHLDYIFDKLKEEENERRAKLQETGNYDGQRFER